MIETATRVSDFTFHSGRDFVGFDEYRKGLETLINNGSALKKFAEIVDAQYGDPEVVFKPNLLKPAKVMKPVTIGKEGYIQRLTAEKAGIASMLLGAGRHKKEDSIDHSAGIILNKKTGDYVKDGEQIAMFYYNNENKFKEAADVFLSGIEIGREKLEKKSSILEVIGNNAYF